MAQMDRVTHCFQVNPLNRKYNRIPFPDKTRQIQVSKLYKLIATISIFKSKILVGKPISIRQIRQTFPP